MPPIDSPLTLLPAARRALWALLFACLLFACFSTKVDAATISGRVTDNQGNPISEVQVATYWQLGQVGNWLPASYDYVYTDANGMYTTDEMEAGVYLLAFDHDLYVGSPYVSPDNPTVGAGIVVSTSTSVLTGYDVVLAHYGRVVGTVLDDENRPVKNIQATLQGVNGSTGSAYDFTDESGKFELTVTRWDNPFILVFFQNSNYYLEYYDNVESSSAAHVFSVQPDEVVTVTVNVSRKKTIQGTITDDAGNLVRAFTTLYWKENDHWREWNRIDGTSSPTPAFQFGNLPRGQFRLRFWGGELQPEYYNNQDTFENAEIIDLTTSPDVVTANAVVTARGVITGKVTDSVGAPLGGVTVEFYYENNGKWEQQSLLASNRQGVYVFRAAWPERKYKVRFTAVSHSDSYYADKYSGNVTTMDAATIITVPLGTVIENIDAQLDHYAVITGTVTDEVGEPLKNVSVQPYQDLNGTDTWTPIISSLYGAVRTDAAGHYYLNLRLGNVRLGFIDETHETEFYNDQPALTTSTTFSASYNSITPNIDVQLSKGPVISGTLTDQQGAPATGVTVTAKKYLNGAWKVVVSVQSDAQGRYAITLASGTYRLRFGEPTVKNYRSEYYPDAATIDAAGDITLTYGNNLTLDAELARLSSISGQVISRVGFLDVGGSIDLYRRIIRDGKVEWSTVASLPMGLYGGPYSFTDVPPGEYVLRFRPGATTVETKFYPNQFTIDSATILTITTGTVYRNIDVVLGDTQAIFGRVVNANNQPIPNIKVHLYHEFSITAELEEVPYPYITGQGGNFAFALNPGERYWLELDDLSGQYADEFYDNQPTLEFANPITISTGAPKTVIVQLGAAASLSGHVTNWSGQPLQGVRVSLYRYWPKFALQDLPSFAPPWRTIDGATASTDAAGNYSIGGLTPNAKYRALFEYYDTSGQGRVSRIYYPKATSVEDGQDIVIPTTAGLSNINMVMLWPDEVLADFTASPRTGTPPMTVAFTDEPAGPVTARQWNFGDDGATSSETNPSHVYMATGVYTVTLTVTGSVNSHVEQKTNYITVTDTPITGLRLQQSQGGESVTNQPIVGETIYFSATSAGSNVTYLWDFGDSADFAVAENVSGPYVQHVYSAPGDYTVTLTARNEVSEQSTAMQLSIAESEPEAEPTETPISNLALNAPDSALVNTAVALSATVSAGDNISYTWDFGDGATGTGQVISHTYAAAGSYTVTVTAGNSTNSQMATKPLVITAAENNTPDEQEPGGEEPDDNNSEAAVSDLVLNGPITATVNLAIPLSATVATGDNVTYTWAFGDGSSGVGSAVEHTYGISGTYSVTVTAGNSVNSLVVTKTLIIEDAGNGNPGEEEPDENPPTEEDPATGVMTLTLNGPVTGVVNISLPFSASVAAGDNVNYIWDFGDGVSGAGQGVAHAYVASGIYTVTVTAGNSVNSLVATKPLTITEAASENPSVEEPGVEEPSPQEPEIDEPSPEEPSPEEPAEETPAAGKPEQPTAGSAEAAISALTLNGPSAGFVHFDVTFSAAIAAGDNVSYTWDFGDGSSASGQTVLHSYATVGTYTITVTASNSQGNVQVTSQIIVKHGVILPRIVR